MIYDIYIKAGILVILICSIFYAGWHTRDRDFTNYKLEQATIVKEHEEKIKSIRSQQELVTKGIQDEYDAKLALLRQYYANRVRQPSASTMPNISAASSIANATAAYNKLAQDCSMTTLQLTELQKWINESIGIK